MLHPRYRDLRRRFETYWTLSTGGLQYRPDAGPTRRTRLALVHQPENSELCGQCCVAMLTGESLPAVIKAIGHRKTSHIPDLLRVLEKLGCRCEKLFRKMHSDCQVAAALVLTADPTKTRRHWLVWCRGKIWDPDPTNSSCTWEPVGYIGILSLPLLGKPAFFSPATDAPTEYAKDDHGDGPGTESSPTEGPGDRPRSPRAPNHERVPGSAGRGKSRR